MKLNLPDRNAVEPQFTLRNITCENGVKSVLRCCLNFLNKCYLGLYRVKLFAFYTERVHNLARLTGVGKTPTRGRGRGWGRGVIIFFFNKIKKKFQKYRKKLK